MSWLGRFFSPEDKSARLPFSDAINCEFTVLVLVALATVTAFPQLVLEEPIECTPTNASYQHLTKYANKVRSIITQMFTANELIDFRFKLRFCHIQENLWTEWNRIKTSRKTFRKKNKT